MLYLLHGIGDTEMGWTRTGKADVILDNLYADKKAVPMIVVMPYGRASAEAGSSQSRSTATPSRPTRLSRRTCSRT